MSTGGAGRPGTLCVASVPIGTRGSTEIQSRSRSAPAVSISARKRLNSPGEKKHARVGVDDTHQRACVAVPQNSGKHTARVAADCPGRMAGRDLGRVLESRHSRDLLRDARRKPSADGGVGQVERLGVDANPIYDRRQRGRQAGRVLTADLNLDTERGAPVAHPAGAATAAPVHVAVPVHVQPKTGAGAHIDENDAPPVPHQGRQGRYHVGAAAHLVHLITVLPAQLDEQQYEQLNSKNTT